MKMKKEREKPGHIKTSKMLPGFPAAVRVR